MSKNTLVIILVIAVLIGAFLLFAGIGCGQGSTY